MLLEQELSDEVLKCCLEIHHDVGPGLQEKIYRNGIGRGWLFNQSLKDNGKLGIRDGV